VTGIVQTSQKRLVLIAGRSYPELAQDVAEDLGVDLVATLRPTTSPTARSSCGSRSRCAAATRSSCRATPTPINKWIMEQLIMVDALKRASAKRDHRDRAVLRLRAAGQEAPRPRADLGAPHRRPVQDRRRRPPHDRRPAHRRRSRASSTARSTTSSRCRCSPSTSPTASTTARTSPSVSPDAGRVRVRRALDRPARRAAGDHPQAPRPRRAQPGQGLRGRRRRRGPRLRARRRHDRHRRHHREGGRDALRERRHGRHRRRHPRHPVSDPARRALPASRASARSSSPTPLPIPDDRRFDKLDGPARSRRSSPARSSEVFTDGSVTSMFEGDRV